MMEIFVAVDGGKLSPKVVDKAVELAKATSAKIVLAYVAPKLSVPDEYAERLKLELPVTDDYYQEFSERVLGDLGRKATREGVQVEKLFGVGNAADFIVDKAKSRKASMIIMGVEGYHNLGRIRALGSVSRRVIENSTIPVVVVP